MKVTTRIIIDTRRGSQRKDGSHPVVIRIYKNNRQTYISTEFYTTADGIIERDDDGQVILKKTKYIKSVRRANNKVNTLLLDVRKKVRELIDNNKIQAYTAAQIKKHILSGPEHTSLTTYLQKIINELRLQNRIGTANAYQGSLNFLKKYYKAEVGFEELNVKVLNELEVKYIAAGKSYNGLSAYLRSIRAAYNQAIREGIIESSVYPFANYSIKNKNTKKRALTVNHLKLLKDYPNPSPAQQVALNVFFFSFNMTGLSFIDICRIQLKHISENRLSISREKSGKSYNIKINSEAQRILKKYMADKEPNDYVFPFMQKSASEAENINHVKHATRNLNRRLQNVAIKADIDKNVTLYTARHTYATLARNKGVDITTISQLLRHSSIKTTQVYLDNLEDEKLDDANDIITDL